MVRTAILIMLGLFISAQTTFGQESSPPETIRVRLSVSGPDTLQSSLRIILREALEDQGDVVITEVNPQWILQIAALQLEGQSGTTRSVVVSVLVLETFSTEPLRVLLSDQLDAATIAAIGQLTSGLFRHVHHWIETGPSKDLETLLGGIASRFHARVAER
jgi:hypothetical protein